MPDCDVSLSAEFELINIAHSITIDDSIIGGIIFPDKNSACQDEYISITITPDYGYQLLQSSLKFNDTIIGGNSFVMPDCDVILTAQFIPVAGKYSISIDTFQGGSVTADKNIAEQGEIINLTLSPNVGYCLKPNTLKYNQTVISGNSFTMPAENVFITAIFELEQAEMTYNINYILNGGDNHYSNPSTYTNKTSDITLGIPYYGSYCFIGWTYEGQETPIRRLIIPYGSTGDKTFTANWMSYSDIFEISTNIIVGFKSGISLEEIEIPNVHNSINIEAICSNAFMNNTNLKLVIIPFNVTTIGNNAFNGCTALNTVTFERTYNTIYMGNSVFENCSSLSTINLNENLNFSYYFASQNTYSQFKGCTALTDPSIINHSDKIPKYYFSGCTSMQSIIVPAEITNIGEKAFENCTNLNSVTFEANSQLSNIESGAFYNCSALEEAVLPNNKITSINLLMFANCVSLSSFTIPEGVTSIGFQAFYGCSLLNNLIIPEGVTSIGEQAFINCGALSYIVLPSTVTQIEQKMIYGNTVVKIFYKGAIADWNLVSVAINNNDLTNSLHFYSEMTPENPGKYWHYVAGVPSIWDCP